MVDFFINRPKFAWVVALLIMIMGLITTNNLPISAYPSIAPPKITITSTYPGAATTTIESSVTIPIEIEMNGIEGLKYIESESSRSGVSTIVLTFETGTNLEFASIEVQNRIKKVESRLPTIVQQLGINVDKTRPDFLKILSLSSPNNTYNIADLSNYIDNNILGEIRRIKGVGSAQLFGAKYAMRIWLNPKKMSHLKITADEVLAAIKSQNSQITAGEIGGLPHPNNQQINATILVPSILSNAEEFSSIILKSSPNGSIVKLSDVARVEKGSQTYGIKTTLNGKAAVAFSTKLSNNGNALETAKLIDKKMHELAKFFPKDIIWSVPYDTSLFVEISIKEVVKTLIEAIILVTIVMFVFLQGWRATIIPLIVIPISLIGTGIGLYLFDFSINMLTLFGMVLAIGIVVDDAILVVENIERIVQNEGLSAKDATKKAMLQIKGPIIGTTAILIAVFVPLIFIPESVGQIYKQFALTIIIAVSLSAFFALSLSPAMAQGLLKTKSNNKNPLIFTKILTKFANTFNLFFDKITKTYIKIVTLLLTKIGTIITMVAFIGIIFFSYFGLNQIPKGFVPSEDQGFMVTGSLLPAGATQERTEALSKKTDAWLLSQPEIKEVFSVLGFGFLGSGQNTSISFILFHHWDQRAEKNQRTADELVADANIAFGKFANDGLVFAFNMPPIPGLGNNNGFDFRLQDKSKGVDNSLLMQAMGQLMGLVAQNDKITQFRPNTLPPTPQLLIKIDKLKASNLNIDFNSLKATLQIALGSAYANDYLEGRKMNQVWIQADGKHRATVAEILDLEIKNTAGGLVKLRELATAKWTQGVAKLARYNGSPSISFSGSPNVAQGVSSGDTLTIMEQIATKLPKGISFEWSGKSLEEKLSGSSASLVFALSLFISFLILVALYESWSIPIAVILVVPLGILGCVLAIMLRQMTNDVYFTIGLITIIALSMKNAIVIVEFSKDLQAEGKPLYDAIIMACKLRFRPILMTSLAFILGVTPLIFTTGAGSAARSAVGTGVFGGMLSAVILTVFFVPIFYLLVKKYLTK